MHNLKDIRNNVDNFKLKIKERNVEIDFDKLLSLDKENRVLIQNKEKFEQEKKILSKSKDSKNFEKSKKLSTEIDKLSKKQHEIRDKINLILSNIPNVALEDVPVGKDEKSNKIIKKHGDPKKFEFKIKSHIDLGKDNMSFDIASKLSG